jgi:hypothetical protein
MNADKEYPQESASKSATIRDAFGMIGVRLITVNLRTVSLIVSADTRGCALIGTLMSADEEYPRISA